MQEKESTHDVKSTEAQEDLGKRGGSRQGNRKAKRREREGGQEWSTLLSSLGIEPGVKPLRRGMFGGGSASDG